MRKTSILRAGADREEEQMADRVVVANYENMIDALSSCARKIYDDAAELLNQANICASALGDSDNAVPQILQRVTQSQQKYAECAATAMDIAKAMQEELEQIREEAQVWGGDD